MKKTTMLVVVILILLCFFSFLLLPGTAEEITTQPLYVGGNGPGNFTKIQDALDNVTAGGTVYVFPGTYHENLRITTPAHLISETKNSTIIDGDNHDYVITLTAGNSTLSGFTIIHSETKFPFAGVYIVSNHNTISNNILTDNFYGMQLGYSASYNLIINNTIHHNGRCGVYFNHASHNRLIGNIVFDHPVNGFGLYEFSNNNSIKNNTFSDNRDTGVNIRESYDNQVTNNTFFQGHVALHKPSSEYHTVAQDNLFTDNVVSTEEERDAFVVTVLIFDILVFFVFLVFRKLSR
ncbi:MAG: right-handed parallel beta-helix repeat-containing protein [Euryarchaeota archaeon]|jgi:parallel beta-helix repeat protein|nr:right-handed parallel beta-helix repeat-containing protein [Euryarchaeota archaeon]